AVFFSGGFFSAGLERDVVVAHVAAGGAAEVVRGRSTLGRLRAASLPTGPSLARRSALAAATTAAPHGPRGALGRVALVAFLVVPLPRAQPALDVHLPSLGQVLRAVFRLLAPHHDAVPLGLFLAFAAFVGPLVGRCHAEIAHRLAARRIAELGIGS